MKYTFEKERTLFLNSEAIDNIEEHYDQNIMEIIEKNQRSKDIQYIIWQAMRYEDTNLTLDDAKKLFKDMSYQSLLKIYTELMSEKND